MFSDAFWICQTLCKIPYTITKKQKYSVLWYETVGNFIYVRSTADSIYAQSIIDGVQLARHSRFSYKLCKKENDRILKLLEFNYKKYKQDNNRKNRLKTITPSNNQPCPDLAPDCSPNKSDKYNILHNSENTKYTIHADIVTGKTNINLDSSTLESHIEPSLNAKTENGNITSITDNNESNISIALHLNVETEGKTSNVSGQERLHKNVILNLEQNTEPMLDLQNEKYSNVHNTDNNEFHTYVPADSNVETERNISNIKKGETFCTKLISNLERNVKPGFDMKNEEYNILCNTKNSQSNISATVQSKSQNKKSIGNVTERNVLNKKFKVMQKDIAKSSFKNKTNFNLSVKSKKRLIPESTDSDSSDCSVKIEPAKKQSETGKRIYNKIHICYYCHKSIGKISRHMELVHKSEMEVAKAMAYPLMSKERKEQYATLTRAGDFYHNCEVLSSKHGNLILVRRPTEEESQTLSYSDYGPCPECLGFMLKKHLWHHVLCNCPSKKNKILLKNVKEQSQSLIAHTFGNFGDDFNKHILNKFKSDHLSQLCREDKLIIAFGTMQFEKYCAIQSELVRQSMRQLARLVFEMQTKDSTCKSLSDCLQVEKFDSFILAVKSLCLMQSHVEEKPTFKIPSLALKLGHHIRKCASVQRGLSLKEGNLKKSEEMKTFLELMDLEWSSRISSNALSTLHRRVMNKPHSLPLTNDVIKLNEYLDVEINQGIQTLTDSICNSNWSQLSEVTLARLIIFNKRRSGEASKMTIQQYMCRPNWREECTQEVLMSLTPLEKEISSRLTLVYVPGKRGRKVAVLLTPILKKAIDTLMEVRSEVEILKENKYVFSKIASENHIRGHECLRKACALAKLQKPEAITSTKLRKYVATVSQLFNLQENECDWLARHLGHNIKVHREFYRLQESAVELTKVSHLLLAVDAGVAGKYAGKTIDEIDISGK